MKQFNRVLCFLCVIVFLFTGCGKPRPDGMPPLYPVTITLTQENAPLEGATVSLRPIDASNEWAANGKTNAKGVAIISARPDFKGAAAGKYKVLITKKDVVSTRGGSSAAPAGGALITEEWTYVDRQYTSVETTPLEIEVTKKGVAAVDGKNWTVE